nr:L,D-transpeptidase family protein [uncultured Pedobacter sp.]
MFNTDHPLKLPLPREVAIVMMTCILFCLSCNVKRTATPTPLVQLNKIEPPILKRHAEKINLAAEFKKVFEASHLTFTYPEQIDSFYKRNEFQPVLVSRFMPDDQLRTLEDYLVNANVHGIDPEVFSVSRIKKLLDNYNDKDSRRKEREVYRDAMELELVIADAMIKYSNALQFGITDPARVYANYSTQTLRPDSMSITQVFEVRNIKTYLDSIQPKDKQYLALQKALKSEKESVPESDSIYRTLMVNLERLRWRNKPVADKYVLVNIPEFMLSVVDSGKVVLRMKVCVGEKEVNKETPQLSSMIYSVQVNPVWNIPQSIASNEIITYAKRNRYYFANNDINVYRNGKLVGDPEAIDWKSEETGSYSFKQQPGEQNPLGRIKFLFNNESSVYLHDTPTQSPFKQSIRAVSHGCVRVEQPLNLAYTLFGKGQKFDQIKKAMANGYPRAKYIGLPLQVPVWITYYTAWADKKGVVHFYKDIYGLDDVLYKQISFPFSQLY